MDKTAIRNFAIEARKILMKSAIAEAGFYGISTDGVKAPIQKGKDFEVYETLAGTEKRIFGDDIKRRENLANAVKELGFEQVIEETAYTWFNRIIAIRFMEVNNYLPTRVRVLSSETGSSTPDIVTQADTVELNMSVAELESIQQSKQDNKYDEAFRLLFIKQCNELNAVLPGLFEKTNDYMELLLKISYTGDGVIRMLVDTIPEDNFNVETEGQVEIIGWMYQYYNTELKDDTFAKLKKNVKITKERIPAATQLFTPDWIVRYMVENSLGRVWIEHLRAVDPSVDEKSKAEEFGWKYYLPEAEQEENVAAQLVDIRASYKSLTPQDITCIDPCMGSGHILVYMFDVLMDIYRSEGFSEREAVFDILEKNIRGLDIDRRAYQLSYFALMMKARGYNRIFFRGHENMDGERVQAVPQVYAIEESNSINRNHLKYYGSSMSEIEKNNALNQIIGLLDQLVDAREYGAILNIDNYDWNVIKHFVLDFEFDGQMDLDMVGINETTSRLCRLVDQCIVMCQRYEAVVTNPPYMGAGGMNEKLADFVKTYYPDTKSDMSTVCMEKTLNMCSERGYLSMINIPVWMFIKSFETLRENLINNNTFISLVHPGRGIFGSDFGSTTFVIKKSRLKGYKGVYRRLYKKQGDVESPSTREKAFLSGDGEYLIEQEEFRKIPGWPIAYWCSNIDMFTYPKLSKHIDARIGMVSGDNERFLRLWQEVAWINVETHAKPGMDPMTKKWYLLQKGGDYRKWYGNNSYVINWENDGYEMKYDNYQGKRVRSHNYNGNQQFKEGISWNSISASKFHCRYVPQGYTFDAAGPLCEVINSEELYCVLAFLTSKVAEYIFTLINPTINFPSGYLESLPYVCEDTDTVQRLAKECVEISRSEWDSYEGSFDFEKHPLVSFNSELISEQFRLWDEKSKGWFYKLKENERKINDIFIKSYGLECELSPEVDDEEITIRQADLSTDVKSLISYAVGCMFGRYSIDVNGLQCAGGEINFENYISYKPDQDNIIPICDESYFCDDIVGLFEKFLVAVYGQKTLEENLDFVAKVIGGKGTSREIIRAYFLNDFYEDHCRNYSVTGSGKRPIYWMFDSGKQNGFKCLIYIHRYDKDTVGRIRSDYLIKTQEAIEIALKNSEYVIKTSSSAVDKAQATRKRDKYIKQLNEIRTYYGALTHIALQKIELDVDRGVKSNYELFQNIEVSNEVEKKQKINLLAKI